MKETLVSSEIWKFESGTHSDRRVKSCSCRSLTFSYKLYLLKEGDVEMDIKTLPGTENEEGEGQREESEEPMLDMTDGSVQEDEDKSLSVFNSPTRIPLMRYARTI